MEKSLNPAFWRTFKEAFLPFSPTVHGSSLPEINKNSNIVNEYQIIHLWENMPIKFKTKNATIFKFKPKQSSITDIIKTFNNEDIKYIFLIKTNVKEILGFSFSGKIGETNNTFYKLNNGFVFNINQEIRIYKINPEYSDILYIDDSNASFILHSLS